MSQWLSWVIETVPLSPAKLQYLLLGPLHKKCADPAAGESPIKMCTTEVIKYGLYKPISSICLLSGDQSPKLGWNVSFMVSKSVIWTFGASQGKRKLGSVCIAFHFLLDTQSDHFPASLVVGVIKYEQKWCAPTFPNHTINPFTHMIVPFHQLATKWT